MSRIDDNNKDKEALEKLLSDLEDDITVDKNDELDVLYKDLGITATDFSPPEKPAKKPKAPAEPEPVSEKEQPAPEPEPLPEEEQLSPEPEIPAVGESPAIGEETTLEGTLSEKTSSFQRSESQSKPAPEPETELEGFEEISIPISEKEETQSLPQKPVKEETATETTEDDLAKTVEQLVEIESAVEPEKEQAPEEESELIAAEIPRSEKKESTELDALVDEVENKQKELKKKLPERKKRGRPKKIKPEETVIEKTPVKRKTILKEQVAESVFEDIIPVRRETPEPEKQASAVASALKSLEDDLIGLQKTLYSPSELEKLNRLISLIPEPGRDRVAREAFNKRVDLEEFEELVRGIIGAPEGTKLFVPKEQSIQERAVPEDILKFETASKPEIKIKFPVQPPAPVAKKIPEKKEVIIEDLKFEPEPKPADKTKSTIEKVTRESLQEKPLSPEEPQIQKQVIEEQFSPKPPAPERPKIIQQIFPRKKKTVLPPKPPKEKTELQKKEKKPVGRETKKTLYAVAAALVAGAAVWFVWNYFQSAVKATFFFNNASFLIGQGRFDEGETQFTKGWELDKNNYDGFYKTGMAYLKKQKFDGALEKLKSAYDIKKENPKLMETVVTLLIQTGDLESARNLCENEYKNRPNSIFIRLKLGELYRIAGNYEKAIENFEGVRKKDANNQEALLHLRRLYIKTGEWEKANNVQQKISTFQKTDNLSPKMELVSVCVSEGMYDKANELLDELENQKATVNENYVHLFESDLMYFRALVSVRMGNIAKARQYAALSERNNTGNFKAHSILGEIEYLTGNINGAFNAFRRALQLNPEDAKARYNLARLYLYDFDNGVEADREFEKLKRILFVENLKERSPALVEACQSVGIDMNDFNYDVTYAKYKTGSQKEAVGLFTGMVNNNPDNLLFRFGLANAYLSEEHNDSAVIEYGHIISRTKNELATNPDNIVAVELFIKANNNAGIAHERQGKISEAMLAYWDAVEASELLYRKMGEFKPFIDSRYKKSSQISRNNLNRIMNRGKIVLVDAIDDIPPRTFADSKT